jgi:hypothetical protein
MLLNDFLKNPERIKFPLVPVPLHSLENPRGLAMK